MTIVLCTKCRSNWNTNPGALNYCQDASCPMRAAHSPLPLYPPSSILMGPAGSGKTTSLVTYLEAGLKLRVLATEPTAPSRIIDEAKKRKIPLDNFDWQIISPSPPSWDALKTSATMIGSMSLADIAKLSQGIAKPNTQQWMDFLNGISNFTSSRTGQVLGDATEWGPDCAFAIDGLTGINFMSRALTVGLKPNPSPGEWGVMQGNILDVVRKLATDCKCFFTLIAHIERESNELTGGSSLTISTLGAKLAPKIPPWFNCVIRTKKIAAAQGGSGCANIRFVWSTADTESETKNGDLPLATELEPSFIPLVTAYGARRASTTLEARDTTAALAPQGAN
jgi:hypothetical protein